MDSYSGGWRMRLALARTLMCRSDLLLLDELTNHLDLDAVIWLESWLKAYPGTLLLISHDRDFLDAIADGILHIDHGRVSFYRGNYSDFEHRRAEQLSRQQAAFVRQQQEITCIRDFVDRFCAKATKARQAQSRLKALERMERIAPAHVNTPFRFRLREPHGQPPYPLLALEEVTTGYGDRTVFAGLDLVLAPVPASACSVPMVPANPPWSSYSPACCWYVAGIACRLRVCGWDISPNTKWTNYSPMPAPWNTCGVWPRPG